MSDDKAGEDRVRAAIELLAEELRRRVAAHPGGHLLAGHASALDLKLRLPVIPRDGDLGRAAGYASEALTAELQSILTRRALFRPGRAHCLRCASSSCLHSAPASAREVFAGYSPTGIPRFAELGQWLLERGDPRVDQIYDDPPRFLVVTASGAELAANLLPAYRDRATGFHLHGQVVAGWFRGSDAAGHPAQVALTFQLASTRTPASRRLYGLNLVGVGPGVGTGPGNESLEAFCNRLGEIPWAPAVRWAQGVLDQIGATKPDRGPGEAARERRLEGLVAGLASRLDKSRRAEGRRTLHARDRHREGARPTRMAVTDLRRAKPDQVLVDTRRDTLVVLGDRGRAHVWSRDGKLVTSIRYSPESIARRQKAELWRPAREEEVVVLRERVVSSEQADSVPPGG